MSYLQLKIENITTQIESTSDYVSKYSKKLQIRFDRIMTIGFYFQIFQTIEVTLKNFLGNFRRLLRRIAYSW